MKPLFYTSLVLATACVAFAEPPKPTIVTIKTKAAQMKYDTDKVQVIPGAKVIITLQNDDDLPHNLVVCKPKPGGTDKGMDVAQQAWALGDAGMKKDWVPENPRIIASTKMVNPHEKQTIEFTAPEESGDYPFVCTFPGHALVMNGVMSVNIPTPPIKNLHYRYYTGEKLTKLPDLGTLKSIEEGQLPAGKVDTNLHFKERKNDFAYEFEGSIDCPKAGDYNFNMGSDDGSQLWIDDKEILKIDGIHPLNLKSKKVKLTKGEHKFKVHFFQAAGQCELYVGWSGPGFGEIAVSEFEPAGGVKKEDKENFSGMPLTVENEARIYRNFIAGSSPRGIAVGYPGGVNLCFDADQMNVALVWQGGFMDAKRHWTGRGVGDQPPLGYGVAKLGQQRALGILASQTDPWVASYKKDQMRDLAYTFHGYELDDKRQPTFRYDFNGVTVTESFAPSGDYKKENAALKRTVTLTTKNAPANLYFNALTGPMVVKGKDFVFDKTLKVTLSGAEPLVRKGSGDNAEVLVPITFKDGKAEITLNYSWNLK